MAMAMIWIETQQDRWSTILPTMSSNKVSKWFWTVRELKIVSNGPMVQERALEFATAMGVKDFAASGGWLDRFKKRKKLEYKENHNSAGYRELNVEFIQINYS